MEVVGVGEELKGGFGVVKSKTAESDLLRSSKKLDALRVSRTPVRHPTTIV